MRREIVFTAGLAVLALAGGCGSQAPTGGSPAVTLNGAGSTFVNPAMSQWAYTYNQDHPNVTINYQSVGSGAGIAQYKAGTVDFGASDAPLSDADLATMPAPTIHIPVVAGCVALSYNIPGVESGLKLDSDTVAGMFLGKIKKWNDPKITALNPGVQLPDTAITIAHRADGSGTSFIFTDYLCSVSPDWANGPGKGKSINWPAGIGGKGNEGVAGLISQTPGCIGYVEFAYAIQSKMDYATLKNKAGAFVAPSVESTSAAANAAADKLKEDVRVSIVNGDSQDAYPIVGFTYLLVSKTPKDAAKAKALSDFLTWCLGDGQKMSAKLEYGPLPQSVQDLNNQALQSVTVPSN